MDNKIFVGNLNFQTSAEQVRELFEAAGAIADLYMPLDRETRRPRGFAFITYEESSAAQQAIERYNGYELDGRRLRVDQATERGATRPRSRPYAADTPNGSPRRSRGDAGGSAGGTPPFGGRGSMPPPWAAAPPPPMEGEGRGRGDRRSVGSKKNRKKDHRRWDDED